MKWSWGPCRRTGPPGPLFDDRSGNTVPGRSVSGEGISVRRFPYIPGVIALLFVAGCATTSDLRRVHGNLDNQIRLTNEKIAAVEQSSGGVKAEIADLRKEDEKAVESIAALRGTLADSRAEVTEIREQIQQIRGSIDSLRRDLSATSTRAGRREDEEKGLRDRLDKLTFKINFIENFLGIGKKEAAPEAAAEKNGKPPASPPPQRNRPARPSHRTRNPFTRPRMNSSGKGSMKNRGKGSNHSSSSTPIPNFPTTPSSGSASVTTSRRSTKRRSSNTTRSSRTSRRAAKFPTPS